MVTTLLDHYRVSDCVSNTAEAALRADHLEIQHQENSVQPQNVTGQANERQLQVLLCHNHTLLHVCHAIIIILVLYVACHQRIPLLCKFFKFYSAKLFECMWYECNDPLVL